MPRLPKAGAAAPAPSAAPPQVATPSQIIPPPPARTATATIAPPVAAQEAPAADKWGQAEQQAKATKNGHSAPPRGSLHADLSDVREASAEGGAFILLPEQEQTYEAQIIDAEFTRASSGNDMIVLQLLVTFPVEFDGAKLYDNVVLTPKALPKFKALCKACECLSDPGTKGEQHFTGEQPQYGAQVEEFKGCIVRFKGKQGESNTGKKRNEVTSFGFEPGFETPGLNPDAPQF